MHFFSVLKHSILVIKHLNELSYWVLSAAEIFHYIKKMLRENGNIKIQVVKIIAKETLIVGYLEHNFSFYKIITKIFSNKYNLEFPSRNVQ